MNSALLHSRMLLATVTRPIEGTAAEVDLQSLPCGLVAFGCVFLRIVDSWFR
jgi:hypothetical protein